MKNKYNERLSTTMWGFGSAGMMLIYIVVLLLCFTTIPQWIAQISILTGTFLIGYGGGIAHVIDFIRDHDVNKEEKEWK